MTFVFAIENLHAVFHVHGGQVQAVRGVSLGVASGECLCVVGESGCGKSVTMQAALGLLPAPPLEVTQGKALLSGHDLLAMEPRQRRSLLGKEVAMIFQDPLASLNPTATIGDQVEEPLIVHGLGNAQQRRQRVVELLDLVGLSDPQKRLNQYPHQLSGGMRQRVMIAQALACGPRVLIADEPTTALDVTIQAQILALIKDLSQRLGMALVLITHDLGVVAQMAHRVAVLYGGQVVETGPVDTLFYKPRHPYTRALLAAMPRRDTQGLPLALQPILGAPPDLFAPPPGCGFGARCPAAMALCHREAPPLFGAPGDGQARCWLHHPQATSRRTQVGIDPLIGDEVTP